MRAVMLAWVALAALAAAARAEPEPAPATNAAARPAPGDATNLWFDVGEELVYRVYWGSLPVGTCTIATEWTERDGRPVIAIRYRTHSNRVLDRIYRVDDAIESWIDAGTFLPVWFEKTLNEGRTRTHETTAFDHAGGVAHWASVRTKRKDRARDVPIDGDTRDIVCFLYYLRGREMAPGTVEQYRVMSDEKIYDVWVRTGMLEKVRLPRYGTVPSLRIDPEAALDGLFLRKGKIVVWVSNDKRRLITRIEASVPIGSVRIVLDEVRGPGDDFWVRMLEEGVEVEPAEGDGGQ